MTEKENEGSTKCKKKEKQYKSINQSNQATWEQFVLPGFYLWVKREVLD
jgi:hypothetical protein